MKSRPAMGMNREVADKPIAEAAEAIAHAFWAWQRLSDAATLTEQASALLALSGAMSDLASWHPDWDFERAVIWDETTVPLN